MHSNNHLTDNLSHGQYIAVKIRPDYRANDGVLLGRVHRGYDRTSGRNWIYIAPVGDNHPGASVTKSEILQILL